MQERRFELHRRLEEVLGREHADALMEHLPPHSWNELPTKGQMNARFDDVYARFDVIDRKFDEVDARFEQVDQRFEQVDQRFEQVDRRFEKVDARFDAMDMKMEAMEHRILGTIRTEMAGLISTQTKTLVIGLVAAIIANSGLMIAGLGWLTQ